MHVRMMILVVFLCSYHRSVVHLLSPSKAKQNEAATIIQRNWKRNKSFVSFFAHLKLTDNDNDKCDASKSIPI